MEEKLRQTLDDLHSELESAASVDAESRQRLRAAMERIQRVLDSSPGGDSDAADADASASGIGAELREALARFEASHPRIARAVESLLDTLGQSGI